MICPVRITRRVGVVSAALQMIGFSIACEEAASSNLPNPFYVTILQCPGFSSSVKGVQIAQHPAVTILYRVHYLDGSAPNVGGGAQLLELAPHFGSATIELLHANVDPDGSLAEFQTINSYAENIQSMHGKWQMQGSPHSVVVVPIYIQQQPSTEFGLAATTAEQVYEIDVCLADASEVTTAIANATTASQLVAKFCGSINVGLFEAVRDGDGEFKQLRLLPADQVVLPLLTTTWRRRKNVFYELFLPIRPNKRVGEVKVSLRTALPPLTALTSAAADDDFTASVDHAEPHASIPGAARDDEDSVSSRTTAHDSPARIKPDTSENVNSTRSPIDRNCSDRVENGDTMPLYELDADQDFLLRAAIRLLDPIVFAALVNAWEREVPPGTTLQQQVHALVREVIRVGGRTDKLHLKSVTEESLLRELDAADAQQDIQLNLELLTCTAVCGEYDLRMHNVHRGFRKESRRRLKEYREDTEDLRRCFPDELDWARQLRNMANLEISMLRPLFHKMALLVEVPEDVDVVAAYKVTPPQHAPGVLTKKALAAADRESTGTPVPLFVPPPATEEVEARAAINSSPVSPTTMLLADKLSAVAEVLVGRGNRKGLVVDNAGFAGGLSARILMYLNIKGYVGIRWMTPPPQTQQQFVSYVVLAVLCTTEELRALLLEADSRNAGAVSAHYRQKERELAAHLAWLGQREQAALARGDLPGVTYTYEDPIEGGYVCPWGEPTPEVWASLTPEERFEVHHGKRGEEFPELFPPKLSDRPAWSTVTPARYRL